ncbi:alpha-hydroxy acid oxidase [Prosthecomicrobium pneumaticum]|uniref:Isopentenyl diphosphate isomerase/L-lactate dehydrogenase-like FMN-dependent dehydrogenase n=1 Tax=Prosthecomicrobium pneumaticum TaxID=81895 RepID=A0A7W9CTH9_9HYPH|nr:alpha-hydroxy acid oxidase [Prosthecomicrobium pneumaticum]MBB5751610.1 isopentenyl diphosphate isomerase/L-lactate dehydrogenase-like FMN-dependent dehydrogenase [Prosthecomicrobium pneumaticum]
MIVNIEDARRRARRRLPRMFFDYLDGGAFAEATMRRNRSDFDALTLEQHVLVDVSRRDLTHHFLGRTWKLPMMLGPIGFCGMMAGGGEVKAATAAAKAGIGFALSTFAIASIEAVRTKAPLPAFQLYMFRDRAIAADLVARAAAAGVETLFVTVDTAVSGIRERDTRNGFRTSARLGPRALLDMALHPLWGLDVLANGKPQLGNAAGRPGMGSTLMAQAAQFSAGLDPTVGPADLEWLRSRWQGRLIAKGVLSARDAQTAIDSGCDGVVVSNHGGRQLDGARSTISVLPEIADAVGGRAEVLLDSGIRRGSDIAKALALGADGVLIGRAYIYGLAAAGEAGVGGVIEHLRGELDVTLALMGLDSIAALKAAGRDAVRRATL